jgi:hypothetical protein
MRENPFLRHGLAALFCCIAPAMMLAGCAAPGGHERGSLKDELTTDATTVKAFRVAKFSSPQPSSVAEPRGIAELDGCGSNPDCSARLKALLADPNRSWVGQPQLPAEHAEGIRQFAYRALRAKLTCGELLLAIDEIAAATRTFATAVPGITSARSAQVRALDAKVEAELRAELASRCAS